MLAFFEEAVILIHRKLHFLLACDRDHDLRLGDGVGEGFLYEQVFAGFEQWPDDFKADIGRSGDDDNIDRIVLHELLGRTVHFCPIHTGGFGFCSVPVSVTQSGQLGPLGGGARLDVTVRDVTASQDGDVVLLAHAVWIQLLPRGREYRERA